MSNGQRVAGGDRLGKTIIFAKNQRHANFIAERFNVNYPHLAGRFARVVTHQVEHAQDLIDKFSEAESDPHIAISVDMLDTGIDVPEVLNLVFFKPVRSRSKFWQMLGRGTRLSPDLFGPGDDKEYFTVIDHCLNLEYFSQEMLPGDGPSSPSLGEKLFTARVELIRALDEEPVSPTARQDLVEQLRQQVAAMNVDNFVVRPHRQMVERFREPDAWRSLTPEDQSTLVRDVAGLPHSLPAELEQTKRFDLLLLRMQLVLLRREPGFDRLRQRVVSIAEQLETKDNIPTVAAQLELIEDILTEEWWTDVTIDGLEQVRRRLRDLVHLLERSRQELLYTDFSDQLMATDVVNIGELAEAASFAQFRKKAQSYLREHLSDGAVRKIHTNQPLMDQDLEELQSLFVAAGIGSPADLETAAAKAGNFAAFVRSIIGLDRATAKEAFGRFLSDETYRADQIRFVNLVVDCLVDNGSIEPDKIYAAPFVDISPRGPEELFDEADVDELFRLIDQFHAPTSAG